MFKKSDVPTFEEVFQHFVLLLSNEYEEFLQKPKVHYLLHLAKNIEDLGPATGFSAEK